jgi:multisubunit Na+/H+ antiporter MnhB subunit
MLISIGVMVVVIVIAYAVAGNEFTEYQLEELRTTAHTSTLVGMGLYATYITFGLTVVAIFYASISKIFK